MKHETSSCKISQSESTPKCFLCGNPHSSRDPQCPNRINYIKMKLKQSSKQSYPRKQNESINQNEQFNYQIESAYPALKVHKSKQFSDWFTETNNKSSHINSSQHINNTLFTSETLLQLTTELITNLQNCRTKLDQFQVITKLAIKYINYD